MVAPNSSLLLRTPREASYTYDITAGQNPRNKNLFYITFTQESGISSGSYMNNLGFYTKSVTLPEVNAKVEMLNQYNKKRLINTSYTTSQVRIVFYDTVDTAATQFFNAYSQQYFGDFRHDGNETDFQYDITINSFLDNASAGYGFAPAAINSTDNNSQFWLTTISIYQVWGGNYVQYDLVNPKIISWAPEGLDYASSDMNMISMSVEYEALIYVNDGIQQSISSNAVLASAFASYDLYGDVIDEPNSSPTTPTGNTSSATLTSQYSSVNAPAIPTINTVSQPVSSTSYGSYSFGSPTTSTNTSTDLAVLALSNPQLASVLNLTNTNLSNTTNSNIPSSNALNNLYTQQAGISTAQYNAAVAQLQNAGITDINSSLGQALVAAVIANSLLNNTQGFSSTTAPDASAYPDQNPTSSNNLLTLSQTVLSILNGQSSGSVQYGVNTAVTPTSTPTIVNQTVLNDSNTVLPSS